MTSLFAQLQAANPEPTEEDLLTEEERKKTEAEKKKERWLEISKRGWAEHIRKSVEKYKEVMKDGEWLSSYQIECRLGYVRTSSTDFIRRLYFDFSLIERRNKGDAKTFCRRHGYEYRWKGIKDE